MRASVTLRSGRADGGVGPRGAEQRAAGERGGGGRRPPVRVEMGEGRLWRPPQGGVVMRCQRSKVVVAAVV